MRPDPKLLAVATDTEATLADGVWTTRCLHCRSRIGVTEAGEPVRGATLEHIVPRSWFGRDASFAPLDGPDDPRNLALACGRCNWSKGKRHDRRGAADPRARAVVAALLERRLARFKPAG